MLRKSLVAAAAAVAVTAGLVTPASAAFTYIVGTDKCNVTTTGPTFTITTLPNPKVTPDGALGASVYCPL